MLADLFNYLAEIFLLKDKNDVFVGLSQLKQTQKPAKKVKAKKQNKDIKISDLMRRC